jgi:hypothetical protein
VTARDPVPDGVRDQLSATETARRTYHRQLRLVWSLALLSGVAAAFAPGTPTGLTGADIVWKAVFAATVTLAAAYADRWAWVVAAAIAAGFAVGGTVGVVVLGFAALGVAIFGAWQRRRASIVGVVAVALASQALLRLPETGFTGATALAATVAFAVVVVSAWARVGLPVRRLVRRVAFWAAVVLVVVVLLPVAFGAFVAFRQSGTAVAESEAWLEAARQGDQPAVIDHLDTAGRSFADVAAATGGWWLGPARALPVVGQQLEAVHLVATSGEGITESASAAARVTTVENLRLSAGQIDVQTLESLRDPLHTTSDELSESLERLDGLDATWLLPGLRSRVTDFEEQVADAADDTDLAAAALDVAPALFGSDRPRTYVVLFASPAESRELGGFVGNIGILNAQDGKLTLDNVVRVRELNAETASLPEERVLEIAGAGYPERYLRYEPWVFWQNVTGTPDFPTVSNMVRDLAPDALGRPIDGVMYVDPDGLAALLRLTGDIDVEGLDVPVGPENAADFLLRDQYVQFPRVDERADFLERIARQTFERLTSVQLPGPRAFGQALGPAVDRGHVRMWAFDPDEQSLFDRLGVSRRLEPNADGDDVMVTISNANPNKADTYLHRTITYDATVDDATDQVRATVAVDLQNDAPTELSDYVVGNANGEPRGSNRTFLSLYTGLDVDGATLDGAPLPVELHEEYGLKRAAAFVTVPPGGRVRVVFDLGGSVVMDERYHLRLHTPTLVQPDRVEVRLRADEGQVGRPELASETVEGEPALGPGSAAFALVGQAELWFPLRK